ncbi:NACHT domain-containing protein [Nonomuraea sp. NPDC050556]|uniref:NACHT domain-containing protein n=1 Tax=Nonomuraea sp. NPDC050556 TaxID=3364369 RepID=UPI0037B1A49A
MAVTAAGKAVAERAMREWLATRASKKDRGAELTDLIQSSFRDRLAPRKFDNQLQGMALAVEGRLSVLLAHEYRGLADEDRAAVLHEVVRTLRAADMSDEALFDADADPARLAERVVAALPLPVLGEAAERLYGVLLAECVECVVGMAQQLPQYLPRAATESLSRLSGLAEGMERLLARMPARSLEAPEGRQDDSAFERGYLSFLSRTLDEVELLGVRVESYRPRTSLSVAYISLRVATGDARPRRPLERLPLAAMTDPRHQEPRSTRIESALARSRLMLLRGEAGSGKSTLLRWLAVTAARGGFSGDLTAWNGCVPLMIKLRSHPDGLFPPPERFVHDVAQEVAGRMPRGWVERVLNSGRGLLLVDGVDELLVRHRPAVRHGLEKLLAAYPGLRVVVTSRPTAADARWLADEGFSSALLEPLTPDDLRELVRQWHLAMRGCPSLPCGPDELEGYEGGLLARLESNPHLRMLGSTPLLAAMVCALNLDRRTHLPRSRMGLYDAVLALLLERRDAERGIGDEVPLDPAQKVWILRDLAWRLVSMGRSELSKLTALRRVEQKLASMTRMPYAAADVLENLLRRSGLLREPVPGRIDFAHKTVQEYLAAGQLVDDEDVEVAVERAHLDQWREVVVMAAGHASGRVRRELLSGLLDRADEGGKHARRLRFLVAGCLETIQEIPVDLRDRIERCLASVIPPKNAAEASLLAAAGEEVLRRLPDDLSSLSERRAALAVRTACLINGRQALDKLASYAADPRWEVGDELITGWDYFDSDEYARRVLSKATPITFVNLMTARHVKHLRHLPNLTDLYIHSKRPITDLSFLGGTPQLKTLSISVVEVDDIDAIGAHGGLREVLLYTKGSRRIDLSPLERVEDLERLIVDDVFAPLTILDSLPRLMALRIGVLRDEDLGPLARQTELLTLGITGEHQTIMPSELTSVLKVRNLTLRRMEVSGGLEAAARAWPYLGMLNLEDLQELDDLAGLHMMDLDRLRLAACPRIGDLTPLRSQSRLYELRLDDLPIVGLHPLADLDQLKAIHLTNCPRVVDLSPLANLTALETLRLGGVADVDLAPLAYLPRLQVIVPGGQRIRAPKGMRIIGSGEWR